MAESHQDGDSPPLDKNLVAALPDKGAEPISFSSNGMSHWGTTGELQVVRLGKTGREMCEGEFESLKAISAASPGFCPLPYAWGWYADELETYFLLSEYREISAQPAEPESLAKGLAHLHAHSASPTGQFGFHVRTSHARIWQDVAAWDASWCAVFTRHLAHILDLARPVLLWPAFDQLGACVLTRVVPRLLLPLQDDGRVLKPCLLHGDCWDGNTATDRATGGSFVFDVCSFYGHNEYDVGNWRAPRHELSRGGYIECYKRYMEPSEPKEDWDARNLLYSLPFNIGNAIHVPNSDQGPVQRSTGSFGMDSRNGASAIPRRPLATALPVPVNTKDVAGPPPPPYECLPGRPAPLPRRPQGSRSGTDLRDTHQAHGGYTQQGAGQGLGRRTASAQHLPQTQGYGTVQHQHEADERRHRMQRQQQRQQLRPQPSSEFRRTEEKIQPKTGQTDGPASQIYQHQQQPSQPQSQHDEKHLHQLQTQLPEPPYASSAEPSPNSPLNHSKQSSTLPPDFILTDPSSSSSLLPPNGPPRRAQTTVPSRPSTSSSAIPPTVKTESSWKKAFDEASYLAGGLFTAPAESSRHHSLIRHSGALVWYRGPSTTVTVSILSDEPLPLTRTLWLQQKGFSGNMGMSLKAMVGGTGSWIDVTPATRATASAMPPNEERGIQRDVKKFLKKATGKARKHTLRETHVVRIPASSQDGYFRIVLCPTAEGKKVLVGSPVFRIASTSTDSSVIRGAGLRTMPLEMGVKVGSAIANSVVSTYVGTATAAVKSTAGSVASSAVKKGANEAYKSYEITGTGDRVRDKVTGSWHEGRAARYERAVSSAMMEPTVGIIGSEEGPDAPFPMKFNGKVMQGSGYCMERYGFPTANLGNVSEEMAMRMTGSFAAWVKFVVPGTKDKTAEKGKEKEEADDEEEWYEAVVRIGPALNAPPSVIIRNVVTVHILHDFDNETFYGSALKVLLMGFLHPIPPPAPHPIDDTAEVDVYLQRHADEILTTMATLARPKWRPRATVLRMKTLKSERSWNDKFNGVAGSLSEKVDRVPMHLAGIRSEAGTLRDGMYGKGGLWIPR